MKIEFTKGEWVLKVSNKWPFDMSIETELEIITTVTMHHYSTDDNSIDDCLKRDFEANSKSIANAKLIAAAPELLKSCQFIQSAIDSGEVKGLFKDELAQLELAIKKATT